MDILVIGTNSGQEFTKKLKRSSYIVTPFDFPKLHALQLINLKQYRSLTLIYNLMTSITRSTHLYIIYFPKKI